MVLASPLVSIRLALSSPAHTRSISWGARFSRDPVSTPRTIAKNTSYRPLKPLSEATDRRPPLVSKGAQRRSSTEPNAHPPRPARRPPPTPPQYIAHRARMKKQFPEGWSPSRTISREAMSTLRELHAVDPVRFRTPVLAAKFKISPEAVSRILKSKWEPSPERKAQMIARDNREKDMAIAERMRVEREEAHKSLKGRAVLMEADRRGHS